MIKAVVRSRILCGRLKLTGLYASRKYSRNKQYCVNKNSNTFPFSIPFDDLPI